MTPSLQELGLAVKRLQMEHHRGANAGLAPHGLSLPQWDVLRHLHAHPDASLHELAGLTFQTDQAMGTLAGRMIGRGLLERVDGPGRAVRHRLTADGEVARVAGSEVVDSVLAGTLGRLTGDERAVLRGLLARAGGDDAPAARLDGGR